MDIQIRTHRASVDGCNSVLFLAENMNIGIVGRCEMILWERTASVRMLYVTECYRRKGVAERLMYRAEADAKAQGKWSLGLRVKTDNLPAIWLYKMLGYVGVWESESDDGDELWMCKRLDEPDETESDLDAEYREIWASLSPAERERAIRMATQEVRGS